MTSNSASAKRIQGTVVSNKMHDTIVVSSVHKHEHPVYKKYVKSTTKYYVDDKDNKTSIGDKVIIESSRPISKMKCWKLVEIVK